MCAHRSKSTEKMGMGVGWVQRNGLGASRDFGSNINNCLLEGLLINSDKIILIIKKSFSDSDTLSFENNS